MNIKLLILAVTSILLYNTYYDKNMFSWFKDYKKYYKMGIILAMGMGSIAVINNSPRASYQNMKSLHDFIQIMPIDRQSKDLFTPLFTTHHGNTSFYSNSNEPIGLVRKLETSGKKSNKRSVSETKKKYVASLQNWKCKHCQAQLTAWFEVDHKIRLEYGGSNEVSNLEALCRECHGKKTSMENM
jgi:5-methylcytosine-specific restriction protein A